MIRELYNGYSEEKIEKILKDPFFDETIAATISLADSYMVTEPDRIKYSNLHLFVLTGDRSNYEREYGQYYKRLDVFFCAYMLTKDEKYISPLVDVIWNICDLFTWSLPAHIKEDYSLKRLREFLDLASCNNAARLAEIYAAIGDKFPELVTRRLKNELRERIIESYKYNKFGWYNATNNWSAVCIAGILSAYLHVAEPEEIEEQIPNMLKSADAYLSGFDDEGCCLEGCSYWSYGFSFFCRFAEMLRNYTKGKIDYFKNPKVHEIAKFQESIAINETQAVSFSDASIAFNPPLELSHFLKSIYPDVQIPSIPKPKKESDLHSLLWINSEFADCKMQPTDKIYHTAQWFIKRGSVYNFACKGGRNNEPHNHNDVGSFMISKCGRVTFTDIGVGKYTRQYFSSERYTVFEPSSRSHSVPIINGELQSATEEKAEVYIETPNEYAFTMQGAYNVASLKSLKRHFKYEEAVLTLSDSYEFTEMPTSLVERFVSLLPITLGEGSAFCGDTVLEFDNSLFDAEITTEECVRKNGSRETVYILDLKLKRLESKISLDFVFK